MVTTLSQKIEIEPTEEQKTYFHQLFGYNRYVYNKALNVATDMFKKWLEGKESGLQTIKCSKYPSSEALRPLVRALPKEDWESEMSPYIFDTACDHVAYAFGRFKHSTKKKKWRFPKYKTKKSAKDCVEFYRKKETTFYIVEEGKSQKLKLPNVITKCGLVKMKHCLRYNDPYSIKRVFISRKADRYFATLILEFEKKPKCYKSIPKKNQSFCGVDLGLKHFVTISDDLGNNYQDENLVKQLENLYSKIRYYQRSMDLKALQMKKEKRELPSKNYLKTKIKFQRLWMKVMNIRNNHIHEITSFLCKNYRYICIEDLSLSNMKQNKHLSRSIELTGFSEFKRQLMYKAELYGNTIIIVDKWFPSTQICSHCGNRKENENKLKMKQNTYRCKECGSVINRDVNAAKNLMKYGMDKILGQ